MIMIILSRTNIFKLLTLNACKNKLFDRWPWIALNGPLGVLKVYIIWLPWLHIQMRIHEIFIVTDRDGRITDEIAFLTLAFHCYFVNPILTI